jgi:hypothetical protein
MLAQQVVHTCLGFHVACGTLFKGAGAVAMAFTLFLGSVYLMLSFVFGKWMGYLILAVCFSGWLMIQSSLWFFGFYSQGPGTPTNQGPRGHEPSWVVLDGGLSASSGRFNTFARYPAAPWKVPGPGLAPSVQSVESAATTFLALQANEQLKIDPLSTTAITGTQFTVDSVEFAPDGKTSLAVVKAHFAGGGPLTTLALYHDPGSVPRYSAMFMAASLLLFLLHLPLLDRAEKKRKEFLTGGSAPAWYGPA